MGLRRKTFDAAEELIEKVENYRNELREVIVALAKANNDKKKLSKEKERLIEDNYILATEYKDKIIADTVRQIQLKMAMHYGTYTDKDMTPIAEVFSLLDQIAKEMLEG
jgi:hypothetical protein